MITKASQKRLTISRRATLQAALAAAIAGKTLGMPRFVAAQTESTGTWNWGGNAGHTGELPGPGLDLQSALGELWRIPQEEFGRDPQYFDEARVTGYANGVVYAMNGDGLWARRLSDGQFLWAQSPAKLMEEAAAPPSPPASPEGGAEKEEFYGPIAIDNGIVIMVVSNGHLWGLDATTGDLRWDFVEDSRFHSDPTVVDHVAYFTMDEGLAAVALTDPPTLRWKSQIDGRVLGVAEGYVYVTVENEVRALTVDDGSEYWRVSLSDIGEPYVIHGLVDGNVFLLCYDDELNTSRLVAVNRDGEVAWNIGDDGNRAWILNETITRLASEYDYYQLESIYTENGNLGWNLDVNASRWTNADNPVLCAGKAYALIRDSDRGENLLVAVDPANAEVFGVRGSLANPLFMADGMMLAQDDDTDEIFAIGSVPAVLQAGGRATVTEDATLRGAPSASAIERAQVTAGTLVDVTGDGETADGTEWMPVTVSDTGESGWLPADVLSGQDGSIRFLPIELYEFGNFTAYPKFTSGTRAEITEQVDLRGAPSETSATKATLDAGTPVTVTSPPTEGEDGEWCPIMVDATGESGWVPVTVLKLVPMT